MRKRTRVDLLLLLLLLAVVGWMWSARHRANRARESGPDPEAVPTPRVQDFMRSLSGSGDTPPQHTLEELFPPDPLLGRPDEGPRAPEPSLLLVSVVTPDGAPHPGAPEIFIPGEDFVEVAVQGRLALTVEASSLRLQARVVDEYGERFSPAVTVQLIQGGTRNLTLEIPHPVPGDPGFRLRPAEEYAEVITVVPGGPAGRAGMQPGDAVFAIDNLPVNGIPEGELNALLLGPPGDPVLLRMVIRNEAGEFQEIEAAIPRGP